MTKTELLAEISKMARGRVRPPEELHWLNHEGQFKDCPYCKQGIYTYIRPAGDEGRRGEGGF